MAGGCQRRMGPASLHFWPSLNMPDHFVEMKSICLKAKSSPGVAQNPISSVSGEVWLMLWLLLVNTPLPDGSSFPYTSPQSLPGRSDGASPTHLQNGELGSCQALACFEGSCPLQTLFAWGECLGVHGAHQRCRSHPGCLGSSHTKAEKGCRLRPGGYWVPC